MSVRTVVGVISDTHGLIRPEAIKALRDSDLILHAGDIGTAEVLVSLARIAPTIAVRGNVDREPSLSDIPENVAVEIGGVHIYMLHDLNQLDLKPEAAGFAAVISGHTHKPAQSTINGVLYFNPGSAGPRRFHLPVACGRLTIVDGKLLGESVVLATK